ncbi:hypothetical protein L3X38_019078 [Prunus dulcis]|uniref:GAG-pre-integrase domain-containing protein n=1 Tax=Prunus dulcis TaxID=3755 RepID=A0AAD4WAY3_PRUDU|nr:hypothetical protein L3X38_019078 [Prunus dulcis]
MYGWSLDNLVARVQMTNIRCFPLKMMPANQLALKESVTHCLQTWHKRLRHLNDRSIKLLEDQEMVHGLPHLEKTSVVCEGCMLGKQHRDYFPSESTWRANFPLELVHTDICGPMQTESISGNRYFLLFTDNCTRMTWVYFIRNKSNAFKCFKKFKVMTELKCGHKNGVAKRKNRTMVEIAKSMLHEKGLPYEFWVEVVNTTVYILNRCPSKSLKKVTPFEAYTGRKPGIAHLKIFGSLCCVHFPSALRHKLEENNHKCIFVGYGLCEKGYRVFDPSSRKIILSRDVIFDENASWKGENTDKSEMRVPMVAESQMANCNEGHKQFEVCEPSQNLDTSTQVDEVTTLQEVTMT